ncbi:MAG TPA: HK97 family phage prohead protease [Solirubrobacter sp.]|nr:HK97 family phage prohead protease [Solirubrobacter sp.]
MSTTTEPARGGSAAVRPREAVFPFRAASNSDTTTIRGYASVFGVRNSHAEVFVPGAFSDTLQRVSDTKPLVMGYLHVDPIGKWDERAEDEHGLKLGGPISKTSKGEEAATLVRDGVLTGLSIGFWPRLEYFADPGEEVTFDTPFGKVTYQEDRYTWYVVRADLVEASLVIAPSDDEARLTEVRSVEVLDRAARAMPALRGGEHDFDDIAYSMALLMGARGAGAFADELDDSQRRALYERLAKGYERHGKTPPEFDARPDFKNVNFAHGERELFHDRYLRKGLDAVVAGAGGASGPLSAETRDAARRAVAALEPLTREPGAQLAQIRDQLLNATRSLTKE